MNNDEKWMNCAIREALKAEKNDEVPVGAVLVKDGKLIAKSHNLSITTHDSTAHAEINLIRLAGAKQKNYRLNGTTLYVTLEPCAMCYGAMVHARVKRLVFGAFDKKTGVCMSNLNLKNAKIFNHKIDIIGGVLEKDNRKLLKSFFKNLRQKSSEVNLIKIGE